MFKNAFKRLVIIYNLTLKIFIVALLVVLTPATYN